MSGGALALVGVVVGALLGGFAQVVADMLRSRHERRALVRTERRDAYAELLAAQQYAMLPMAQSVHIAWRREAGTPYSNDELDRMDIEREQAGDRMSTAVARISLLAPEDTADAGFALEMAVRDYMKATEDVTLAAHDRALVAFLKLARRDLG